MNKSKKFTNNLKYNKINELFVKDFILKTFQNKRTKKPFVIYKQLVIFHNFYPKLIEDIFRNIDKLGYWKDCMFALLAATSLAKKNVNTAKFSTFIYDLLVKTIEMDKINYDNRKKISTLGKWLPRENRSFDKKLNFVDNYTAHKYLRVNFNVDKQNLVKRKVEYRKEVTSLNKYLGTAEINFSNLAILNDLDFNKISPICVAKNRNKIVTNPVLLEKYKTNLLQRYNQSKFWKHIHTLCKIDIEMDIEKEIAITSWNNKLDENLKELHFLDLDFENIDIVVELSNHIISNSYINYIIGTILLIKSKYPNTKIFCVGKSKELKFSSNNIFDIISVIKKNCYPFVNDTKYNFTGKKVLAIISNPIIINSDYFCWFLKDELIKQEGKFACGIPYIKKNVCQELINKIINKHFPKKENKQLVKKSFNYKLYTCPTILIALIFAYLKYINL